MQLDHLSDNELVAQINETETRVAEFSAEAELAKSKLLRLRHEKAKRNDVAMKRRVEERQQQVQFARSVDRAPV